MKRHRWMAIVPYEVTVEDGLRMVGALPSPTGPPIQVAGDDPPAPEDPRPFLGLHNIVHELVSVGCLECEQPLTAAIAETPCPGEPAGKLAYVDAAGADLHPGERMQQGSNVASNTRLAGVGRNDPCPCGSGKKYKRCHGGPS